MPTTSGPGEKDVEQDVVRLWWWNPGGGASSQRVLREDLDVMRMELRAEGCTTWVTRAIRLSIYGG